MNINHISDIEDNIIYNNLVLDCSKYIKSKGNDLIHFLVKDSRKNDYFNKLKEYLNIHPDKVNIQNDQGWTPLMMASRYSNTDSTFETVELLLQKGADPNIQNNDGWTALMMASRFSNTTSTFETVEYLLEHGANPNIQNNDGWTALMMASRYSNTDSTFETVECLLSKHADPNLKSNKGSTALMMASLNSNKTSNFETVKYLLEQGADPNIKDKNGRTALMMAKYYPDVKKLLLEYGAYSDKTTIDMISSTFNAIKDYITNKDNKDNINYEKLKTH